MVVPARYKEENLAIVDKFKIFIRVLFAAFIYMNHLYRPKGAIPGHSRGLCVRRAGRGTAVRSPVQLCELGTFTASL